MTATALPPERAAAPPAPDRAPLPKGVGRYKRPGRRVAFANQKGGVGKTTTTVLIAAAAASRGARVLVIDLDPQCHATSTLRATPGRYTVAEILTPDPQTGDAVPGCAHSAIVPADAQVWPAGIDVIPCSLLAAERETDAGVDREIRLATACEGVADLYDLILLDLPPSLGVLSINGLTYADEVDVVIQPHRFGVDGAAKLSHTIARIRKRLNPGLVMGAIIAAAVDMGDDRAKRAIARERLAEAETAYGEHMPVLVMRRWEAVNKATDRALPLSHFGAIGREPAEWFDSQALRLLGEAA
ncbi:ParA family protein [Bailinhaonella thermotolerans]|uniref:AAA domain-containing protein n=1 Tax=Bailinhaonella thermotolerans TaxID=1070861 RepID=A0A3A4AL87_9ACTN|nr:AAA family ATPase [Bailinhaonella thermotolerans]RJL19724.1 hypothetical protein D5H75_40065 [Bailinhaonella thermotolerans]